MWFLPFTLSSFRGRAKPGTRNPVANSERVSGFRVRSLTLAPRNDQQLAAAMPLFGGLPPLGHAPGADHLHVVIHQRTGRSRVAQLDEIGELAVNFQNVP